MVFGRLQNPSWSVTTLCVHHLSTTNTEKPKDWSHCTVFLPPNPIKEIPFSYDTLTPVGSGVLPVDTFQQEVQVRDPLPQHQLCLLPLPRPQAGQVGNFFLYILYLGLVPVTFKLA
jgi:hypothetical protein